MAVLSTTQNLQVLSGPGITVEGPLRHGVVPDFLALFSQHDLSFKHCFKNWTRTWCSVGFEERREPSLLIKRIYFWRAKV